LFHAEEERGYDWGKRGEHRTSFLYFKGGEFGESYRVHAPE